MELSKRHLFLESNEVLATLNESMMTSNALFSSSNCFFSLNWKSSCIEKYDFSEVLKKEKSECELVGKFKINPSEDHE